MQSSKTICHFLIGGPGVGLTKELTCPIWLALTVAKSGLKHAAVELRASISKRPGGIRV